MAQFQQAPRFGSRERWIAIAILYAGLIIYILYGGDNVEDDTLRDYDDDELLHSTDNKITPDKQQENSVRSAPKLPPLESLVQRTDAVSEKLEHLKQEIESGNCSGCTRREEQVVCGGIEAGWTKTKFCGVLKTVADNQLCPESGHGNLEYHTTWWHGDSCRGDSGKLDEWSCPVGCTKSGNKPPYCKSNNGNVCRVRRS